MQITLYQIALRNAEVAFATTIQLQLVKQIALKGLVVIVIVAVGAIFRDRAGVLRRKYFGNVIVMMQITLEHMAPKGLLVIVAVGAILQYFSGTSQ